MQADLQCNDKINWIRMRERGPQDHKKEMKSNIPEAAIYIWFFITLAHNQWQLTHKESTFHLLAN